MASDDIPPALTSIYSYLVNGNIAKSHAFNPKSDYINGLDLRSKFNDQGLMKLLTDGTSQTSTIVHIYRHALVDMNILRMVFLEATKAAYISGVESEVEGSDISRTIDSDEGGPTYTSGVESDDEGSVFSKNSESDAGGPNESDDEDSYINEPIRLKCLSSNNGYQIVLNSDQSFSVDSEFNSTIEHVKSFFNDPTTPKDLPRIMNVFDNFNEQMKVDFVAKMIYRKKNDSKMKNRISILAKIIKPNLTQINDVEGLKVVANHLLDPNFKFRKKSKKIKDLQEQFKEFKQQNSASAKSNTNKIVDFKITGLKDLEEPCTTHDSYIKCLKLKEFYTLDISINSKIVRVDITEAQAYLLFWFRDSIQITKLENYGFGVIWGLLDSYIDFASEKNIQRLLRPKQKKNIGYSKDDLLQDRLNSMKSSFRGLGVSFSGTA